MMALEHYNARRKSYCWGIKTLLQQMVRSFNRISNYFLRATKIALFLFYNQYGIVLKLRKYKQGGLSNEIIFRYF